MAEPGSGFKAFGESFKPISPKYVPTQTLGKGAFGVVCAAIDRDTGDAVAIKQMHQMCKEAFDGKHTLRELRLMRWLGGPGGHPNIVALLDAHVNADVDTIDFVMELATTDVRKVIKSSRVITEQVCGGASTLSLACHAVSAGRRRLASYINSCVGSATHTPTASSTATSSPTICC